MSEIVVSLTTVPSRVHHLARFLDSMEKQTILPTKIELNLPTEYHKRNLGTVDRKIIPKSLDIYDCEDFGPATKILPTLSRYSDKETRIIYCDDDRFYNENWIHNLVTAADRNPESAICDECISIDSIIHRYYYPRKDFRYKVRKALSFGRYRPYWTDKKNASHVAQGFGGVLVRPSFFTDTVFSIPDILWSVDDIWLSGHMTFNGTDIRWSERSPEEKSTPIFIDGQDLGRQPDALTLSRCDGFDRLSADYYAVRYYQKNFGIWSEHGRASSVYSAHDVFNGGIKTGRQEM